MNHLSGIKNIIFDLGGVLLNLSQEATIKQFSKLGRRPEEEVRNKLMPSTEFYDYEKGLISDEQFRDSVRNYLGVNASDSDIDQCWNAMLLGIPVERLRLLEDLKNNYRTFLLSNTSEIHLVCFSEMVQASTGKSSLDHFFEKAYYSHRMKMRKPDREIYETVLNENKLMPEQTLFLDDNLPNLEGAERCGIKTFHVQYPDLIFTLFNNSAS